MIVHKATIGRLQVDELLPFCKEALISNRQRKRSSAGSLSDRRRWLSSHWSCQT
ncbi:MAG: hypothetical protein J6I58_07335 [Eubacterium sp.]|nr:hypothetical protein [Eubacterium sp.]